LDGGADGGDADELACFVDVGGGEGDAAGGVADDAEDVWAVDEGLGDLLGCGGVVVVAGDGDGEGSAVDAVGFVDFGLGLGDASEDFAGSVGVGFGGDADGEFEGIVLLGEAVVKVDQGFGVVGFLEEGAIEVFLGEGVVAVGVGFEGDAFVWGAVFGEESGGAFAEAIVGGLRGRGFQ
jgi:hypothetical protein